MAASLADFAQRINTETQAEARCTGFPEATRIHGSFLAAVEKRALVWMAERMPAWVNSDHLTTLGFAAQIATGVLLRVCGLGSSHAACSHCLSGGELARRQS